jgi:hypothetical protein
LQSNKKPFGPFGPAKREKRCFSRKLFRYFFLRGIFFLEVFFSWKKIPTQFKELGPKNPNPIQRIGARKKLGIFFQEKAPE